MYISSVTLKNGIFLMSLVFYIGARDRRSRQLDAQPAEKDAQPADLGSSVAAAPLAGAGGNRRGA